MRRYVHGDGPDEPVASYEGAGLSTRYYLHADERGSVVAVSDATGAGVATSKYSVDGASASLASEFGFTGQLWLPSVQLYYYKARMYSPQLGRFMQRDPLGYAAGLNLYVYAGGDPVNARDPSGLTTMCIGGGLFRIEPKPTNMLDDNSLALLKVETSRDQTPCYELPTAVGGAPSAPNPDQGGAGGGGSVEVGCNSRLPNGSTIGDQVRHLVDNASALIDMSSDPALSGAALAGNMFATVFPFGPLDFKNLFKGSAGPGQLADMGNFAYGSYVSALAGPALSNLGAQGYAKASALFGVKAQRYMAANGMSKSASANVPRGNLNPGCLR